MARRPRRSADKAGVASAVRKAFEERLHPRGAKGQFKDKPGGSEGAPSKPKAPKKETTGERALKTSGVTADDRIEIISKKVRAYDSSATVRDFVDNHPKGRAYALRKLAADHKAGRIGFSNAKEPAAAPRRLLAKDETDPRQRPKAGTAERRFHDGLLEAGAAFGPKAKVKVSYHPDGRPRAFLVDTGDVSDVIQRTVNIPRGEGERSVDHDIFMLDKAGRPAGQAKRFLAKSIEAYRHLGVETVNVHANINVGGYAWLKYGFKPDELSAGDLAAHGMAKASALRSAGAIDDTTFAHLKRALDNQDFHAAVDIGGARQIGFDGKKQSLGKHLFLGSDWTGKLDLYSRPDMARFNAYVSKGG